MARVALRPYVDPGGADVFVNLKMINGDYYRIAAFIDTGAAVSMFPAALLFLLDHRLSENGSITIEQAGIAKQSFKTTDIGFDGVLDQAVFYLNYLGRRTGWIEISD